MKLEEFFSRISKSALLEATRKFRKLRTEGEFYLKEVEPTYRFFHQSFKMIWMKISIESYIDILLMIFGVDPSKLEGLEEKIGELKKLDADRWWVKLLEDTLPITMDTLWGAGEDIFIESWKKLATAFYTTKIICVSTIRVLERLFKGILPGKNGVIDCYEALFFYIWVPEWRYSSNEQILGAIRKSGNKELIGIFIRRKTQHGT